MAKKISNIRDIYSLTDCFIAADISTTFDNGYCPIAIKAPDQISSGWCYTDVKLDENHKINLYYKTMSLKLKFAIQVWHMANGIMNIRSPYVGGEDYRWHYEWVKRNESFNRLKITNTYFDAMVLKFYDTLKFICDNQLVQVSEGYEFKKVDSYSEKRTDFDNSTCTPNLIIVLDYKNISEFKLSKEVFNCANYSNNKYSYSWDEIKSYFVTVSLPQMELLHVYKIHRSDERDKALFNACEQLDINAIRKAIKDGCNIYAIDEYGESTIQKCVENAVYGYIEGDKCAYDKAVECIDELMSHGVDINLLGCGCTDIMYDAVHCGNIKFFEYLLKNGANPNVNSALEDILMGGKRSSWYIRSSSLEHLYNDMGAYGPDELDYKLCDEMESLLLKYGAQLYIDGYNPDTNKMEIPIE